MDIGERGAELIRKIYSEDLAHRFINSLNCIDGRLDVCMRMWLNGKEMDFKYGGTSIRDIMQKEGKNYVEAILTMNLMMKHLDICNSYHLMNYGGM